MSESKKMFDVFEDAGFTVTWFYHLDTANYFKIAIKSTILKDVAKDYEKETAKAGDIISLIEKNNYRLIDFKTGVSVVSEYAGTIYFEIIPADAR
ncbi:MAG: hypothetical protein LBI67_08985 [Treponema sp.]|jgi:hypothetical protein|nr:hypothetical protein [Treponema sp.]